MKGLSITVALSVWAMASSARANSMVTHIWVAEQSIERIEPGPLRDIVSDPVLRSVIQNGAFYPDSGYAVRHPYGEWAHWESWIEPYLQWIRRQWRAERYQSHDARRHVAFLLGCAAHSMTDQTFDQYFGERARQYDHEIGQLDIGSDAWVVVEHGVQSEADGRFWVDELPRITAEVGGPAVTAEVLTEAGSLTAAGTRFLTHFGYTLYTARWRAMPWAASHYWDPATPGSYPHLVSTTAEYWRFLWRRLNDDAATDAPPLYSWPSQGQVNFPVDHGDIESRIVVTTPWGLDDTTVNETTVRLLDRNGRAVKARVSRYGDHGNTIMVRTESDLAYDSEYTVELSGALMTLAGMRTGRVNTIGFHTRCAPDRLGDCQPLVSPTPTLREPPVSNPRPTLRDAGTGTVVMVDDAGSVDASGVIEDSGSVDGSALMDIGVERGRPEASGCGCKVETLTTERWRPGWGLAMVMLLGYERRKRRSRGAMRQ